MTTATTYVHGVLANGEVYSFAMGEQGTESSELVGRQTSDGWWVKGALNDGQVLMCKGKGYKVTNRAADPEEVRVQLKR